MQLFPQRRILNFIIWGWCLLFERTQWKCLINARNHVLSWFFLVALWETQSQTINVSHIWQDQLIKRCFTGGENLGPRIRCQIYLSKKYYISVPVTFNQVLTLWLFFEVFWRPVLSEIDWSHYNTSFRKINNHFFISTVCICSTRVK